MGTMGTSAILAPHKEVGGLSGPPLGKAPLNYKDGQQVLGTSDVNYCLFNRQ